MTVMKALLIWLSMVVLAVVNGLARDKLIAPVVGPDNALPLSGITLSLLIFVIVYLSIPWFGEITVTGCFRLGMSWACLTVAFEYGFGHYLVGKPWHDIHQVFDFSRGDLFSLALISATLSPWLSLKLRGTP